MRQIKEFAVLSVLTLIVLLSCKKDARDTPPDTPPAELPKEKIVKAKVIEYGSDLPIEGATLSICTTVLNNVECDYVDFISNVNGECFFKTDSVYLFGGNVIKDWYDGWLGHLLSCLLEVHIPDSQGTLNTPDSFTVRLVPYRYVTVHVKDTGTTTVDMDQALLFITRGALYARSGDGPCYTSLHNLVELRPQIDTTLYDCFVYGNADNEFIISTGVIDWESRPIGVIHQEIKYIPKGDSLTVEFIY